jgi:hypothetical protein
MSRYFPLSFLLSQYGDLHLGQMRTSSIFGGQICPQRLHVSFCILIFICLISSYLQVIPVRNKYHVDIINDLKI